MYAVQPDRNVVFAVASARQKGCTVVIPFYDKTHGDGSPVMAALFKSQPENTLLKQTDHKAFSQLGVRFGRLNRPRLPGM